MTENTQPENVSLSTETATSEKFAFPATPQQKQLWFVDQLDRGNPAYNIPLAYELRGLVDAESLDESLHWVLNRHETFRTVFSFCGEKLLQVVSSEVQVRFNRVDLRAVPESSREAACRRAIDAASAYRFNLASGPLVRADLLLLEDSRSVLVFNFQHIILDQASVLQFADEFCLAYDCFKKGLAPEVKAPQLQYPDFSVWQEEQFEQPQFQVDLSDWVREFDSVNPSSVFPTDHPRPIVQAFTGREAKFSLTPGLSARIREFARTSKKSLYVTLLTFFDCLLARYSGQDDVVVGSPFSNRMISGLEDLMGCCMNTLPLRAKLGEAGTFRAALEVVHQSVLAAYGRQRVPLQLIVDKLEAERYPGMNPLFQSLFMFQEPPMMIKLEGLEITPLWIHDGTSKFDMTIWLWDSGEQISGLWEYDTNLYEADTINRLILNFETFVSAAMSEPDTAWRRLPLAGPQEVKLLTQEFNRTERNWQDHSSLVELLEQTATARPETVALVFDDEKMTYRELMHSAETLAHRLTSLGVKSGSLVGICVERSPDMVIAMIAILKSGAAYLPLDLAFPEQRLSFMIEDSGLRFIVTNSNAVSQLPPHKARTVLLDEKTALAETLTESVVQPDQDSLAYVRYTSGSTGRPKGVAISHQALLNFLRSMREQPGYTNRDVLLAVTTLSFDISELEIWLPLLCGGTIVLATRNQVIDGAELSRLIARHGVTVMQATPATWWLMIEAGWKGESRLKALCGGEALSPQLADGLVRRCAELWNMYGPTETTVWSSCSRINSIDDIHIGRPIANTELFVLDSYLEPVPIGVAGELFIGGDGLSHGYLNRPELTAEKFVPNPFKTRSRLYRTGDLARYRADGNLVCLGRLDQQVKLNGFRIELGEIESVIRECDGVSDGVVTLRGRDDKWPRLAAYIVPGARASREDISRKSLDRWQEIWNLAYRMRPQNENDAKTASLSDDPTFNISGRLNSYTGEPFAPQEMTEWLSAIVDRILTLKPKRVLEIGCGTGLILYRMAPLCATYIGVDFSESALSLIQEQLTKLGLTNVKLVLSAADNLEFIQPGSFDLVIINSVVQYFPSADYMTTVLRNASRALAPEGHIFIGDVRSLPLTEVFHTSLELENAHPTLTLNEVRRRVRVRGESELLVDPGYFYALQRLIPEIGGISILLKLGHAENEMTRFRYDVIVHFGSHSQTVSVSTANLIQAPASIEMITDAVKDRSGNVRVRDIVNPRVVRDVHALQLLSSDGATTTVADLNRMLGESSLGGIDPEDVYGLEVPYNIELTFAESGRTDCYDALFITRPTGNSCQILHSAYSAGAPVQDYCNKPLDHGSDQDLVKRLKKHLKQKLPDFMFPAWFAILQTIPLTPNGKIDRNALPAPEIDATEGTARYVAPRTKAEERLTNIWESVLKHSPIGVHDNFFDLGGHSLLAVTLFAKVEREFGRHLPLASLFQNATIAQLARLVETDRKQADHWESLVCIREGSGAHGVFFVHGAGGNILIYRNLAHLIHKEVPVYGLQSLGLDRQKRPLHTIEEMALSYVDAITRHQHMGPYVLAGYCMRGRVALEMARVLRKRGQSVAMVGKLDSFNINVTNAGDFKTGKLSFLGQSVTFHASNLFAHGRREAWLYLREKTRQAREAASGWSSSMIKNFHPLRRNGAVGSKVPVEEFIQSVNDRAGFAYVPRSYSGPVTLFKPKRNYYGFSDPKMGWSEVLTGPLEIVELDMNPHAMLVEPFVQKLAAEINIRLCDLFKLRPSDDGNRAKPGVAHPTSHT